MEKIKNVFLQAGLSENDLHQVCSYFKRKSYKKDQYLLSPASIAQKLFFIETGSVILGQMTDTKPVIRHLVMPSEFVTALESFHQQSISNEFIKATTNTLVYETSKVHFDEALQKFPLIQGFYQNLIFSILIKCQQRITALTSMDAKTYLEHLRKENPALLQNMHQYDLASYMGIEPQSLSRLRTPTKDCQKK